MSHVQARKRLRKPHLALLVLLSLGMAAQAIISVPSQTHEFLLHAEAGETYTHDHVPHQHDEGVDPDGPWSGGGQLLHALLHQPCSGHCTWIDGLPVMLLLRSAGPPDLPDEAARRLHSPELTTPFRPPIRG